MFYGVLERTEQSVILLKHHRLRSRFPRSSCHWCECVAIFLNFSFSIFPRCSIFERTKFLFDTFLSARVRPSRTIARPFDVSMIFGIYCNNLFKTSDSNKWTTWDMRVKLQNSWPKLHVQNNDKIAQEGFCDWTSKLPLRIHFAGGCE